MYTFRSIYEVQYLPWVDNDQGRPWLYSGSDYFNDCSYLGSASSSAKPEWAGGLTVRAWWRRETKQHPERFRKVILLELSEDVSRVELQALESAIQTKEDHRNDPRYFNRTNKHFKTQYISTTPTKGMTYEEIYGEERGSELRQARAESTRKARGERYWHSNSPGRKTNKGKTYEEMLGVERAAELKKKRSKHSKKNADKNLNDRLKRAGKHSSQIIKQCAHCGKRVSTANYARWHGDNCRNKNDNI